MRASIKDIFSLELDEELDKYRPSSLGNFGISLRLMIGTENEEASESFDIFVCTPQWISEQLKIQHRIFGRHMLIVAEYDFGYIYKTLVSKVSSITGNNWEEIADELCKIASWEFDEYH